MKPNIPNRKEDPSDKATVKNPARQKGAATEDFFRILPVVMSIGNHHQHLRAEERHEQQPGAKVEQLH